MKNLIIILTLLLSFNSYSQVKPNLLDNYEEQVSYLFNSINDYREANGLNRLALDSGLVKACEMHSIYMSFYNCAGHYQTKQDSMHLLKNIPFFRDRAIHHGGDIGNWLAENSTNVAMNLPWKFPWGDGIEYSLDDLSYADYAFNVINAWKWSRYHNETLLNPKGTSAGVYQYLYVDSSGITRVASAFLITNL